MANATLSLPLQRSNIRYAIFKRYGRDLADTAEFSDFMEKHATYRENLENVARGLHLDLTSMRNGSPQELEAEMEKYEEQRQRYEAEQAALPPPSPPATSARPRARPGRHRPPTVSPPSRSSHGRRPRPRVLRTPASSGRTEPSPMATTHAMRVAAGKKAWRNMSPSKKASVLARLRAGRSRASAAVHRTTSYFAPRRPAGSPSRSPGFAAWLRKARMVIDVTAPAVGVAIDPARAGTPLRQRASDAIQRYLAVGLDGSIDSSAAFNSYLGIGTAAADDWLKRRWRHYQYVGQQHILPTAGELVPYLFTWDAVSDPALTARQKLQAGHDCFVETTAAYIPSSGKYVGLSSDRFKAYEAASHLGRIVSKAINRYAPSVGKSVRELTGWSP